MAHLFKAFLDDPKEYSAAEYFWQTLWLLTVSRNVLADDWRAPWFQPQPPNDGNPIFSAVSDSQRKGIRIIQYPPTTDDREIDFWLDTFGGPATDPHAINELVIACALSDQTSQIALNLMSAWRVGNISIANLSYAGSSPFEVIVSNPPWRKPASKGRRLPHADKVPHEVI